MNTYRYFVGAVLGESRKHLQLNVQHHAELTSSERTLL